jgi:hypothetical protein
VPDVIAMFDDVQSVFSEQNVDVFPEIIKRSVAFFGDHLGINASTVA